MKTEHLLIIRFSAMGDVAMTVPVVCALAKRYPDLRITVLSRPFARTFFDDMAPNVGFMAADLQGDEHGIKGLNALYRRLSAKHFTAIADLHNTLRSKYLRMRFNLSRNHVEHINKHKHGKRLLTAELNKRFLQQPTAFQNYADVFERLGYPIDLAEANPRLASFTNLSLLPDHLQQKPAGQRWIGIAPYAAHKGKVYPQELLENALQMLTRRHQDLRLFFFGGGKTEQPQLQQLAKHYPGSVCVADELDSLQQEIILMSQLDAMLSMDSANMHLASLVATPVVSIWGATHPYAGFMGWQQPAENAIQVPLSCRPCSVYGKKACRRGDYACLNLISPEIIVRKLEEFL